MEESEENTARRFGCVLPLRTVDLARYSAFFASVVCSGEGFTVLQCKLQCGSPRTVQTLRPIH